MFEEILDDLKESVDVIQQLSEYPNQNEGLSGAQLQERFDRGSNIIKEYLNESLVPFINRLILYLNNNKASTDQDIADVEKQFEQSKKITVDFNAEITAEDVEEYRNAFLNGARLVGVENDGTSVDEYLCIGITKRNLYFQRTEANLITTVILDEYGNIATSSHFLTTSDKLSAEIGKEAQERSAADSGILSHMQDVEEALQNNIQATLEIANAVEEKAEIDATTVGADAWSSKNIVDKLCPAFGESGAVVTCEPVERYPLEVITTANNLVSRLTLTRCGKNFFDFTTGVSQIDYDFADGSTRTYYGYTLHLPAGTYTIHAEPIISGVSDYMYGTICDSGNIYKSGFKVVAATDINAQVLNIEDGDIIYVYRGGQSVSSSTSTDMFKKFNVQIEVGSVATAYEKYRGETWEVDFSNFDDNFNDGAFYDWNTGVMTDETGEYWQHDPAAGTFTHILENENSEVQTLRSIPALSGVNYIYSSAGVVTVTGRKDPIALLEKQNARLEALEAAIINNT